MTALAVAHPGSTRPRQARLRPVPDLETPAAAEPPVTVTISIAGGASGERDRVLEALRDLVELAGSTVEVTPEPPAVPAVALIRLDPRARTAVRAGRLLDLSRLEFDLLLFLARNPRQVFSRGQLLARVWGHTHTTHRTVDVHVSRLRTKLAAACGPAAGVSDSGVTTVYGLGYRLADDAAVVVGEG